jgi:hypothetical protein
MLQPAACAASVAELAMGVPTHGIDRIVNFTFGQRVADSWQRISHNRWAVAEI